MQQATLPHEPERWRIIVVGAEDVAQRFRRAGHRVLSLTNLPVLGSGSADAAVLELERCEARSANRFRVGLVEPVLIHRRRAERAQTFLSIGRRPDGGLNFDLLEQAVANAVARTRLLRLIDAQEADSDAPTEQVTLEIRRPSKSRVICERTVVARLQSLEGK